MPGAAEGGGVGDRGVKSWTIGRCKVGGAQWVEGKGRGEGREFRKAEWEREGGRE